MTDVVVDISMSLDGFVAGPDDGLGRGLGEGGAPFRPTGVDKEVGDEMSAGTGAAIVGRRTYDVVDGWGDESPFGFPVFVLTSREHPRRDVGETSYTFVTDGIESALAQAREAAGDKDVSIGGGARVVQQFLAAGLVDAMQIHLAPVLVGEGTRLFDHLGPPLPRLEQVGVRHSPYATHIRYRVENRSR